MLQSLHLETPCLTKTCGMTGGRGGSSERRIWTSGGNKGRVPARIRRGCRDGGMSNCGTALASGLVLDFSMLGVDLGVGLDCLGLLLRDVSSCFLLGEILRAGEAPM